MKISHGIQVLIIFAVCVLGEILHQLIPLPISSGVYGMVIMLIFLLVKIIKVEQIEEVGNWLVKNMLIMFIPVSVGLINSLEELKTMIVPIVIAIVVVTPLVMVVTGKVVQFIVRITNIKEEVEKND